MLRIWQTSRPTYARQCDKVYVRAIWWNCCRLHQWDNCQMFHTVSARRSQRHLPWRSWVHDLDEWKRLRLESKGNHSYFCRNWVKVRHSFGNRMCHFVRLRDGIVHLLGLTKSERYLGRVWLSSSAEWAWTVPSINRTLHGVWKIDRLKKPVEIWLTAATHFLRNYLL